VYKEIMSLLLSHRTSHLKKKILKSGKNKNISWTPEFHTSSRVSRTLPLNPKKVQVTTVLVIQAILVTSLGFD
jgi:hypothetical protein